ncbi:MAG: hypothetical protein AAGI12_07245 [Pseudomonadota bacterium]
MRSVLSTLFLLSVLAVAISFGNTADAFGYGGSGKGTSLLSGSAVIAQMTVADPEKRSGEGGSLSALETSDERQSAERLASRKCQCKCHTSGSCSSPSALNIGDPQPVMASTGGLTMIWVHDPAFQSVSFTFLDPPRTAVH